MNPLNYFNPNPCVGRPEFNRTAPLIVQQSDINEVAKRTLNTSLDTQLAQDELRRLIPCSTRIDGTRIICSIAPWQQEISESHLTTNTTSNAMYLQNPLGSSFELVNGSIDNDSFIL